MSGVTKARLEIQLASDLRKLAHALRFGHLSALKRLICHVDRTPSSHPDADPNPLQINKDSFFKLGGILEFYHGFEVLYSEEEDYYLVVARKHSLVLFRSRGGSTS